MLSRHPPERLEVELQSRVSPSLSERGYRVVGYGSTGITWRRDVAARLAAGLVLLGLLALGGVSSGDAGFTVFGVLCALGGGVLFYFRRPATVTIGLTRVPGGTEWTVSGGPDSQSAEEIAKAVAGPSPAPQAPPPGRPEAPGSRWDQPLT